MSPDTMLYWLLRTSMEGSALVLVVLAIRSALGSRLTPGWRVAMWGVVALKLVLPASLPTMGFGSLWSDRVAVTERSRGLQSTDSASKEMPSRSDEGTRPLSLDRAKDVVGGGSGVAARHMFSAFGDRGLKPTATFLDRYAVGLVWMVGAMAMLGLMIVRELRFRRALSRLPMNSDRDLAALVDDVARMIGLRHTPRIVLTEAASVPAVAGLVRPVLLMPRDWSTQLADDELDSILRHELLHLKHHDLWLNWSAALLNAIHWFNPLVWIAVARCQEDRELRCDDRALAIAEPAKRIAYGRVLLRLQEHFTAPPAIAGVAPCVRNHPPLHQRILMITNPTATRPWFHALCTLMLGLIVCVSFGSARAQDEKPNRTREGERNRSTTTETKKGGEGEKPKGGDGLKMRGTTEREGKAAPTMREGEGMKKGARDGEGGRKSAEGDGANKKTGARDGEGTRTGPRDGDTKKTGMRDGEGSRKSAEGEGNRKSAEGEGARKTRREGTAPSESPSGVVVIRVTDKGESVVVDGEKVASNRLRAHLMNYLPEHRSSQVVVEADDDVPYKQVTEALDAARDNGAKTAKIATER